MASLNKTNFTLLYVLFSDILNTWYYWQHSHKLISRERERNVLFNDALNTFYLRLYGIRYMVKDHSDSEKGNPLPPHELLFLISNVGSLYAFICRITHTTAFVTPVWNENWKDKDQDVKVTGKVVKN